MSGDKSNGVDWQAELKARLEAYEKRTGRQITGKKTPDEADTPDAEPEVTAEETVEEEEIFSGEDPGEELPGEETAPEEIPADPEESVDGETFAEEIDVEEMIDQKIDVEENVDEIIGEDPFEESDVEESDVEESDVEESEGSIDFDSEPDFLAVLDGIDDEEDADSFLFRERLSRDRDRDDDEESGFFEESGDDSVDGEDSYFDETREETTVREPGGEPVVKVVNIEEFRMDQGLDEGFDKVEEDAPLGIDDQPETVPEEEEADEEVPKEIIVSRLLSGVVDMVIAVITAAGFMEIVAWKLSRNFFEVEILQWIAILALLFYILSSLYFLTLVQRTPGMQLAELKLIAGRGRSGITFFPVLIRTLSYFPSALSVTGLVWAFFDHQTRCLHDIVSGTRVVSTRIGRVTLGL